MINIWLDDEYGLADVQRSPNTVVDLGANIGLFSLWARHQFPAAIIHAYEPNKRITGYTRKNLEPMQVRMFEEAAGGERGSGIMIDRSESRLASTQAAKEGDVPIVALADIISRIGGHVDLMKIDCEGAEWDMFRDRDAFKCVSLVRMEYHLVKGLTVAQLLETVRSLNFAVDALRQNQGFGIAWLRNSAAGR